MKINIALPRKILWLLPDPIYARKKNCNSSYGLISVIKVYGALKYIRILAHLCIYPAYAWYAIIEIERVKVDRS